MSILHNAKRKLIKRAIVVRPEYATPRTLLAGRSALVVGGGTGIGLAISRAIRDAGARVTIASRSPRPSLIEEGYSVESWDVSDIPGIRRRFNELANGDGFDIVVCSQGICPEVDFRGKFFDVTPEDFEQVVRINAESPYFVAQAAASHFIAQKKRGHIVVICSTEGLKGGFVPYGISKGFAVSMVGGLGKYLARRGITINGIAPGATATKMMSIDPTGDLSYDVPSGRCTLPEEIANMAVLLASDMGAQMCGQVITIDGGESLH